MNNRRTNTEPNHPSANMAGGSQTQRSNGIIYAAPSRTCTAPQSPHSAMTGLLSSFTRSVLCSQRWTHHVARAAELGGYIVLMLEGLPFTVEVFGDRCLNLAAGNLVSLEVAHRDG